MKIGILTFHYAYNYGAVLQAEALYSFLRQQGHDVGFVNYFNKEVKGFYGVIDKRGIKRNSPIVIIKKIIRFRRFQKYIDGFRYFKPEKICNKGYLDAIIVGSDQVWNIDLTKGFDDYYWMNISYGGIKIAYAASMNSDSINLSYMNEIERLLKNFDFISVRESSLQKELLNLSLKGVELVVDPTLLISPEYWLDKVGGISDGKYVLAYPLRDGRKVMEESKKLADAYGLKLFVLRGMPTASLKKQNREFADPMDFLKLFANASYVVTSSFHGTAFSIVFKKKFFTLRCSDGNNVRTESLLRILSLENRLISEIDVHSRDEIDYHKVSEQLRNLRDDSQNLLINALQK